MKRGNKNLTLAYEGNPLCFQTAGIPPKAGDELGETRVRTVFSWPGEPGYQIVILEALSR